jgi:hypothetical protein
LSSEQLVLVGEFAVVHAKDALVDVVDDPGVAVSVTVGGLTLGGGGGGGGVPASTSEPKSCVQ